MKAIHSLFIVFFLLMSCNSRTVSTSSENSTSRPSTSFKQSSNHKAQNVIFMIGDGMGLTQMTSGYIRNGMKLELERVQVVGLSKTDPDGNLITDSAAGATAFSIGEKSFNGAIGVDKNKIPKETILEKLGKEGYSTGLIATCAITHATPAAFYAHQPSRNMAYEIAADMVNAPLDAFIGGGKDHFHDRTNEKNGEVDSRNILEELEGKGFHFVNNLSDFVSTKGPVGYFIADGHPKSILEGRDDILPRSIEPMVTKLSSDSDKGFFLMVEGSQIDWGGHANDSEYIITEMIDFDTAIGKVLDFAQKDGNTLVVITADHETGGYSLEGKNDEYNEVEGVFTTLGHTATMVPVYAFGPGAENFQGIYNNNEIYNKILKSLDR